MHDLIIKGGRVIDPMQNLDAVMDVAIDGTRIAAVAGEIPEAQGRRTIDARNRVVAPGLIDFHCHVYDGVVKNGAAPDSAGVRQGVTTLNDCGSAGQAIFGGFPRYVIPSARTTVFCFLHLCSFGLSILPELWSPQDIDTAAMEKTIAAYPGLIKGVKLRLTGGLVAANAVEVVKLAKSTAKKFDLPVMIHIGDVDKRVPQEATRQVLPLLEAGDIVSHLYTPLQGRILLPDGRLLPEFEEAVAKGVILDSAHGRYNFSFAVAEQVMAQGILPTTISTDLTVQSLVGPVYGLTVTMSKFMALGMGLTDVIRTTTLNPARILGIERSKGGLKPGMDADVSILEVAAGRWALLDTVKKEREVTRLIVPRITVKSGQTIPCEPVAWPEAQTSKEVQVGHAG